MKTARNIRHGLVWSVMVMFAIALGTQVQPSWAQEGDHRFRQEELAQMLAPIALYPDSLIAQMLMASTYPLEVVEAERWLRHNQDLQGDALYEALRHKPWDPSVKSLCPFPDILFAMSDKLEQTKKLGDAFLAQEREVMETIQKLRRTARKQGTLVSTEEQKIIMEREIIRIEPASPGVVYVPVYDPYHVYGPWWYPDYPPYYWYYPARPFASGIFFSFGPRIFIGAGLFSWVWFDWYVHRIYIEVPRTYIFHHYSVQPSYDRHYWRHDPRHRKGVSYRDRKTSEHFGTPAQRLQPPPPETPRDPAGTVKKRAPAPAPAPAPVLDQERTFTPETPRRQQRGQSPPRQDTSPPPPVLDQERTFTPEAPREQQRGQSPPRQGTSPPIPSQDTPSQGSNDGSVDHRAGELEEENQRSGAERYREEKGMGQDDARGRGNGPRR